MFKVAYSVLKLAILARPLCELQENAPGTGWLVALRIEFPEGISETSLQSSWAERALPKGEVEVCSGLLHPTP